MPHKILLSATTVVESVIEATQSKSFSKYILLSATDATLILSRKR
jgi:hypothetical protein